MKLRLGLGAMVGIVVLLSAACGSGADDAKVGTAEAPPVSSASAGRRALLTPMEFAENLEVAPNVPVVNVHTPYEGHIDGTDHFVPFDQIADWEGLPEDRSAPIVLYCRSGNMSAQAAQTLEAMGYERVVDLKGGMNAWTEAGFELLTEPPASEG